MRVIVLEIFRPDLYQQENKDSNVTKTAEFDITVTKAGSGVLTLKGDAKAPQLDKFEITPKDVKL